MSNDEPKANEQAETEDRPSIADLIYIKLDLPKMEASRRIRGYIIDEILTALLREGVLTKEQLAHALAEGERSVKKTCESLSEITSPQSAVEMAAETSKKMKEAADEIIQSYREEFIDGRTPLKSE